MVHCAVWTCSFCGMNQNLCGCQGVHLVCQSVLQWMPTNVQYPRNRVAVGDQMMFIPVQVPFQYSAATQMFQGTPPETNLADSCQELSQEAQGSRHAQVPFQHSIVPQMFQGTNADTNLGDCVGELSREAQGSRQVQEAIGDQMMFAPIQVPFQHSIAPPVPRGTHPEPNFADCVWELSRDAKGSREVQKAIDNASNDNELAAMANQLRGRVWQALECQNANHVLQKMISSMRPQAAQFVVDEIMSCGRGCGAYAARHRFGCRVVERLLEHCQPEQVGSLVEDILEHAPQLCSDQFGNFVVQHVLEFGCDDHKHRMSQVVAGQIASIPADYHGCAVVSAALTHSLQDDKIVVAQGVLRRRGLLASMARQRHGHDAVMSLLNMVNTKERANAERQLEASIVHLQKSRYGRVMAKYLESLSSGHGAD